MAFLLYIDSYTKYQLPGIPLLVEGYDNLGEKHWFYIGQSDWSLQDYKIPIIIKNGKSMYVRKGSRKESKEDMFTQLHTKLKESTSLTYTPGESVTFNELLKILSESGIDNLSSGISHIIYTLFTDVGAYGSYGWLNMQPYYENNMYNLNSLGHSNLYSGMNLYLIEDNNKISSEWNNIMGTIYEQIIRGLSSPGNWEELSNSEYGLLFKLRSGWGFPEIMVNNDITIRFSNISIEKEKKSCLISKVQLEPLFLAKAIARGSYNSGILNSSLKRRIDFSRYDNLFKNANIIE